MDVELSDDPALAGCLALFPDKGPVESSTVTVSESWRPVPGYEESFEVSDLGRVRSLDRVIIRRNGVKFTAVGQLLSLHLNRGYPAVTLHSSGTKNWKVHKLVMNAFVGPCPPGMEVCHNDGNPLNCVLSNLRYDTHSSNGVDRAKHGVCWEAAKTHCSRGHSLVIPNLVACKLRAGKRECKSCNHAFGARSFARRSGRPDPDLKLISDQYFQKLMRDEQIRPAS